MKIVFLDIDGVLNSDAWFARSPPLDWGLDHLDPEAVARVDRLASATAARIVISSAWRLVHPLDEIRAMLAAKGLRAPIIDSTPEIPAEFAEGRIRAKEIATWLGAQALQTRREALVESFVILDDLEDFGHLERYCVRTKFATGLLDEHVVRASALLGTTATTITPAGTAGPSTRADAQRVTSGSNSATSCGRSSVTVSQTTWRSTSKYA